jgi:hypothetical protein
MFTKICIRTLLVLTAIILYTSCIKEAKLNYRKPQPSLVVEGLLLTDSTPCKVTLSYSGLFNENGGQLQDFIDDAEVYLKDVDANDSVQLVNQFGGTYVATDGFVAAAGRAYALSIHLSNGERYASLPERIVSVPKDLQLEDSIGVLVPPDLPDLYGADVKIRTHDPANETNYYRWITTDYLSRKATGIPCGMSLCNQYCYQLYEDKEVRILSDALINGNEIRNQSVLLSPYYYYGKHYIEIKQLSLTREAYEFWKLYQEQTTRTGTIFDPLPSPLQGNIYSVDDPNKLALGYFEASDVASLKIILAPIFIDAYYTLAYVKRHIYPDFGNCWDVYPNAIKNPPPGWENVTPLIYYVY